MSVATAALLPPRSWRPFAGWLALGLGGLLGLLLLGHVHVLSESGIVLCSFKRLTGIGCPGCGMTRALAALGRGDLLASLRLHAFAPLLVLEAAWVWAVGARSLLRQDALALPPRLMERLVLWQGAAMLAFWLGRLATGTLPV